MPRRASRQAVYAAAELFAEHALRRDDSLFTPGVAIWSLANLDDLHSRFNDQPNGSSASFEEKFRLQLAGASEATVQLAGELIYFHLLVAGDMRGATKRSLIGRVLSWSEHPVALPDSLGSALDVGICNSGVAFKTYRPNQLWYLIDFARAWKNLEAEERDRYLADPWAFMDFAFGIEQKAAFSQRQALLHLVHPDAFEPMVSRDHLKAIAKAFGEDVAGMTGDANRDAALIRAALEPELGVGFDFYAKDIVEKWLKKPASMTRLTSREAVLEAIAEYDDLGQDAFLTKYEFGPSRSYFLIHDGKQYDSKAIVGAAYGVQHPEHGPLLSAEFSGGDSTVRARLEKLGFTVQGPAGTARTWCVYISANAGDSFQIGLDAGTWGAKVRKRIEGARPGDCVLFVHGLQSEADPTPVGWPRVELDQFRGIATRVVRGQIESDVFEDATPRWPDDVYPWRVRFKVDDDSREVPFSEEIQGQDVVEATRRSMLRRGQFELAGAAPINTDGTGYFLLYQSAESESSYGDREGLEYHFDTSSSGSVRKLASAVDARFIYYRSGESAADGTTRSCFAHGRIESVEQIPSDGRDKFVAHLSDFALFERPVPYTEYDIRRGTQNSIADITQEEYERMLELGGSSWGEFDLDTLRSACEDHSPPLRIGDAVLASLLAATESGKHVILTGPPGTGKTTLAEIVGDVARAAGRCRGYTLTTATADWTTYETIGGLLPTEKNALEFSEGHFLEAIRANHWLVIDELNRSNFDRAFGQLFTVLSGQTVTLPYRRPGQTGLVALVPPGRQPPPASDPLRIPAEWRVLATMNVFDKSLLFEMSFALMRRFAFIEVPSPKEAVFLDLMDEATAGDTVAFDIAKGFLGLRSLKDLGPAVFIDMARFLRVRRSVGDSAEADLAFEAFYAFLLPQFEGIDQEQGEHLFKRVRALVQPSTSERLRRTLVDVLGLELAAPKAANLDEDALEEDLGVDLDGLETPVSPSE